MYLSNLGFFKEKNNIDKQNLEANLNLFRANLVKTYLEKTFLASALKLKLEQLDKKANIKRKKKRSIFQSKINALGNPKIKQFLPF